MRKKLLFTIAIIWLISAHYIGYFIATTNNYNNRHPTSEVITLYLGEGYHNGRRDECKVYIAYAGKIGDVVTFAPIEVGIFKAYSYNIFMTESKAIFRNIQIEILSATQSQMTMKISYPHGNFMNVWGSTFSMGFFLTFYWIVPIILLVISCN